MWTAPDFASGLKDRETSSQLANQKSQGLKVRKLQELLREEAGRRAIAPAGIADPARAELDPAVAEAEVRSVRETAIPARSILVASAVDPEIVTALETFGMCENHAPDFECAESELVACEDFAGPTNGATPVAKPELCCYDQNVEARLLVTQCLELLGRTLVLSEIRLSDFAFAVVVEIALALLLDKIEHLLNRLVVGLGDRLPARDGKPSFGIRWKWLFGQLLIGESDAWEELPQDVGLLRDPIRLVVARQVSVARLDFLVGELVAQRVLLDGSGDVDLEFVAILDEFLNAVLVEEPLGNCAIHGIFRKTPNLLLLTICNTSVGDRCFFHRHPSYIFLCTFILLRRASFVLIVKPCGGTKLYCEAELIAFFVRLSYALFA